MRDDIKAIPIMEAAGWTAVVDQKDVQMGRQHTPNHPYSFTKGVMTIWKAVKEDESISWRYAELIDESYKNHKWLTIEEASKL